MIMRFIVSVALMLPFYSLQAQTAVSHKAFIKRVTKRMAYVGVLKCELVTHFYVTNSQYLRFESLRKECTNAELTALLKHRAPVVRVYAFWALSERPGVDLLTLLVQNQQDTAKLASSCGFYGSVDTAIDKMLSFYRKSAQYAPDKLAIERQTAWEALTAEESVRLFRKTEHDRRLTRQQKFDLYHWESEHLRAHEEEDK